jgi:hypothetical protein
VVVVWRDGRGWLCLRCRTTSRSEGFTRKLERLSGRTQQRQKPGPNGPRGSRTRPQEWSTNARLDIKPVPGILEPVFALV